MPATFDDLVLLFGGSMRAMGVGPAWEVAAALLLVAAALLWLCLSCLRGRGDRQDQKQQQADRISGGGHGGATEAAPGLRHRIPQPQPQPQPQLQPQQTQPRQQGQQGQQRQQRQQQPPQQQRARFSEELSVESEAVEAVEAVVGQTCRAGHKMEISDYLGKPYSNKSGWSCDLCFAHSPGRGSSIGKRGEAVGAPRWLCQICPADYCFDCHRSGVKETPGEMIFGEAGHQVSPIVKRPGRTSPRRRSYCSTFSGTSEGAVLFEGSLSKKSTGGIRMIGGKWQKRYFVLYADQLCYFADAKAFKTCPQDAGTAFTMKAAIDMRQVRRE